MSRGIIFGVGLLALTLVAFLCIPRHLPVTSEAIYPSFSASIENGQLTLSGVVRSEPAKQAALARAQQLVKGTKLHVTDDLEVMPGAGAAEWEAACPHCSHNFPPCITIRQPSRSQVAR